MSVNSVWCNLSLGLAQYPCTWLPYMTPNSCWCKLVKYWPSLIRGLFLSWTRPCTSLLGCGGVGDGWFKEGWRGLFLAASASSGATNLTPAKALWFSVLSPSWTFKTVKLSLLHVYYSWAAHTFCPLHSLCSHHGSQCLAPWSPSTCLPPALYLIPLTVTTGGIVPPINTNNAPFPSTTKKVIHVLINLCNRSQNLF